MSPWATPSPRRPAYRTRHRPPGAASRPTATRQYWRASSTRPVSSTSRVAAPPPKTSPAGFSRSKDGPVARQIDAVDASADLITVTIGANDVGLPSDAEGCEVKSADPPPCTDEFVVGNVDRISQLIAAQLPVWGALIDQLRITAPHARIVVVGYGTFMRPGGCFPAQPVLPRDADYLQSKLNELDDLQQQLAAKKAIDYFDTRLISQGHDICAAPSDRYIEGFVTTGSAVRLHPNAFGVAAVGNALAGYLGKPGSRVRLTPSNNGLLRSARF